MKLKICFLAGTNSIHSHRWADYFSDAGHEVHLISFAPTVQPIKEGIYYREIISNLPKPLNFLELVFTTRKALKKIQPDILHAHSAGIYGLVAVFTGFHPFILTAWGTDVLLNPRDLFKRVMVKLILKTADLITCDGDNTTDAMVRLDAKLEKIKRILFGTDIEKFKPGSKVKGPRTKTSFIRGKQKSKVTVISLRSLEPVYDIETLVKAAAIIVKAVPETKFIIAGDGEQREYLTQLAENLGLLPQYFEFIGRYKNENLPQMLNDADIYVSTSLSDSGLAASTAEAMASGLPIIVSDSGDNKKWIEKNKGGFVIPCGDYQALAEKLIYLLKNPAKRKSFGKYNRKIIEEKNNYYKEMKRMEKLYQDLISK